MIIQAGPKSVCLRAVSRSRLDEWMEEEGAYLGPTEEGGEGVGIRKKERKEKCSENFSFM